MYSIQGSKKLLSIVLVAALTACDDYGQPADAIEVVPAMEVVPAIESDPTNGSVPPLNSGYITIGSNTGEASCINMNLETLAFGQLSDSTWQQWFSNFTFSIGEENLSVVEDDIGGNHLRQKFDPTSNGSTRAIMNAGLPQNKIYRLAQSIYLEPGWDWGGEESQGGKIAFGLGGGSLPSGGTLDDSGFTARLMWRGAQGGTAKLGIYSYAADRGQQYGEDNLFAVDAPIGEWINIIYEIKANSSINQLDGAMRAWIDGELVLDKQNVGWQLAGDTPVIDTLSFSSFYGGNTSDWAPDHTTYARMRDVCWAPVINGYSGIDPEAGRIKVKQDDLSHTPMFKERLSDNPPQ